MSEGKVYRSESTRWTAALLTFIFAMLFIAGINELGGGKGGSTASTVIGVVEMFVALLAIAWSVFYLAQMGVTTSDHGIVIRNWFRRRFIQWLDVKEFNFGTGVDNLTLRESLATPYLQTYVITNDDHHYVMCGITATRINRAESRRRVQEILNRLGEEKIRYIDEIR